MNDLLPKLKELLGDKRLAEITNQGAPDTDNPTSDLTNAKEIYCECNTLILRPNHARLIIPSDSMVEMEKELKFLHHSDKLFKNLVRGCYWLVDDMYKFEQMGYTKPVNLEEQQIKAQLESNQTQESNEEKQSQTSSSRGSDSSTTSGYRYLACAECNICPLGWFDPRTKESYLYVW